MDPSGFFNFGSTSSHRHTPNDGCRSADGIGLRLGLRLGLLGDSSDLIQISTEDLFLIQIVIEDIGAGPKEAHHYGGNRRWSTLKAAEEDSPTL